MFSAKTNFRIVLLAFVLSKRYFPYYPAVSDYYLKNEQYLLCMFSLITHQIGDGELGLLSCCEGRIV